MTGTQAGDVRPPFRGGEPPAAAQLDLAVARGIITPDQRDRILALPRDAGTEPGAELHAELRAGLNLVTVAYWAGAIAVLFALAWFLVDRWKSLRPAGVLAVALLYAVSFALSSGLLRRLGYRVAASLLTLLAVSMAPIVAWCVLSLLGLWPEPAVRRDLFNVDVMASVRWIPVQLGMALAGLVALRVAPAALLSLTVAIPCGLALVHLTPVLFDPELNVRLFGWVTIVAGMLQLGAAYVADGRRTEGGPDYAGWLYVAGAGFLFVGVMSVFGQSDWIGHLLPIAIALLVTLALTLHRRFFLLPAALFFVSWLVFLAREVFPTAVSFMIVVLALGAMLILATVVMQRRYPALLRRLSGEGGPRRAPATVGAGIGVLAALSIVFLLMAVGPARAWMGKQQERRDEMFRQQVLRQRAMEQRGAIRAQRAETPPPRTP
jgi:hypothetical protein